MARSIIQFREVFLTPDYLAIAMEFAPGGDMFQYVKRKKGLQARAQRHLLLHRQALLLGYRLHDRLSVSHEAHAMRLSLQLMHPPLCLALTSWSNALSACKLLPCLGVQACTHARTDIAHNPAPCGGFTANSGALQEHEARWFFQQLIVGLDYCHKMVRSSPSLHRCSHPRASCPLYCQPWCLSSCFMGLEIAEQADEALDPRSQPCQLHHEA